MFERLLEFARTADWGRFSPKLAPIFAAYGAMIGLLTSSFAAATGWLAFVAVGMGAACLGGYLLPRKGDVFGRGPLVAQLANGVVCAIACSAIFGFSFGGIHFGG